MFAHKNIIFFHDVPRMVMIKNDALKRKVVCLHIFESQDNTIDRAKTGIGDKDTGKI